jgi:hypothetical protein
MVPRGGRSAFVHELKNLKCISELFEAVAVSAVRVLLPKVALSRVSVEWSLGFSGGVTGKPRGRIQVHPCAVASTALLFTVFGLAAQRNVKAGYTPPVMLRPNWWNLSARYRAFFLRTRGGLLETLPFFEGLSRSP